LEGQFDDAYYKADNSIVIPTDTVKNTVYVLAKQHTMNPIEDFALFTAKHFLGMYAHVSHVSVYLNEVQWTRVTIGGKQHAHGFQRGPEGYKRFVKLYASRQDVTLKSGFEGMDLLKTTGSGFEDFWRDKYTTLVATRDRCVRSKVYLEYSYTKDVSKKFADYVSGKSDQLAEMRPKFDQIFNKTQEISLFEFFGNPDTGVYAPSVQLTIYDIGKKIVAAVPQVNAVYIAMPNLHCILANLAPFKMENNNEVFYPTEEPHGQIEAMIAREVSDRALHPIPDTLSKL